MAKKEFVLEILATNRNVLLGVIASILLIGTCSRLDAFVIAQNNATVGILSTIGSVCAAVLMVVIAIVHMVIYSGFSRNAEWFIIPILAVALVWTIVGAYLIALYK